MPQVQGCEPTLPCLSLPGAWPPTQTAWQPGLLLPTPPPSSFSLSGKESAAHPREEREPNPMA